MLQGKLFGLIITILMMIWVQPSFAEGQVQSQFAVTFIDRTSPWPDRPITGGTLNVTECAPSSTSGIDFRIGERFCSGLGRPNIPTSSNGGVGFLVNWNSDEVNQQHLLNMYVRIGYHFVGPSRGGISSNNQTDGILVVQFITSNVGAATSIIVNEGRLIYLQDFLPPPTATTSPSPGTSGSPGASTSPGGTTPAPGGTTIPLPSGGGTAPPAGGSGAIPIPTILPTQPPNTVGDINSLVTKLYSFGISLAGVIFIILFLVGGLQYLTTAGNEEQTGKAKKLMVDAVIGLVLVLGAYAIAKFIGVELGIF